MESRPASKNDIDRLESNAALISAFLYYPTWFGLQSLAAIGIWTGTALFPGHLFGA